MATLTKKLVKAALPEMFVGKDVLINGERVKLTIVTFSDTRGNDGVKVSDCVYAHVVAQHDLDAHIEQIESIDADQELQNDLDDDIAYKCTICNDDGLYCNYCDKDQPTVSYIAKPSDSRCAWWSMIIQQDTQLDGNRLNAPYLCTGANLELKAGDMLIDSEANHHRKNRGYTVVLCVCDDEKMIFIKPSAEIKRFIKLNGGQDLMHESGNVNACIRMAVWLRRQLDLNHAVQQLLNQ